MRRICLLLITLSCAHAAATDAVVELDRGVLRFESSDARDGYTLDRHTRVRVLAPAGHRLRRLQIGLDHWTELQSAEVRVGGEWRPLEQRIRATIPQAGVLYSDARVALLEVPAVEVGDTFEVRVRTRVSQGFWIRPWRFERDVPVRESRLEVVLPEGLRVGWSHVRDGAPAPFEPKREGDRLVWSITDLPALRHEPWGLPPGLLARQLRLSVVEATDGATFAKWDDLARWYHALTKGLDAPVDTAEAPPGSDPAALFRYVRDRVRYVAVHEGIGALRPHPARLVHLRGYGDCKDMTTLLLALLRARGVEAWPALVGTRGSAVFDRDFPSVALFDHVVVAVRAGQGWTFADPTAKHLDYGALSWAVQDRDAVVVQGDRAVVVRTPRRPLAGARDETWHVGRDGTARLEVELSGEATLPWLDHPSWSDAERARVVERRLVGVEASASDVRITGTDGRVSVAATLAWPHAFRTQGPLAFLALGGILGDTDEVRVPADRRSPVTLGAPRRLTERVVIPLEPGEEVAHLPPPSSLKLDLGDYRFEARAEGRQVVVERAITFDRDRVEPAAIADLRALVEAREAGGRAAVALKRPSDAPAGGGR